MSAYDKQIGGTHYRKMKIQPSKFVIERENLPPGYYSIELRGDEVYRGKLVIE